MEEKKNHEGLVKLLCYIGIFVLLMFIILPPLFRMVFPEEEIIDNEEPKKLIMNLSCVKTDDFVDYQLITTVNTNYIENKISDSTFTYEIQYTDDILSGEEIIIDEYEELKKISNVDFKEEGNKYILTINYANFDYNNEPALENHRKMLAAQIQHYSEEHFECQTSKVQ